MSYCYKLRKSSSDQTINNEAALPDASDKWFDIYFRPQTGEAFLCWENQD